MILYLGGASRGEMNMPLSALPPEWTAKLTRHKLIRTGEVHAEADGNMMVLPLSDVRSPSFKQEDIARFLMEAFHTFCRKAAKSGLSGWFYAWYDEMSGTLRCSACGASSSAELPFTCDIDVVDSPDEIAYAAATSKYVAGVPAAEFPGVQEWSANGACIEFTLAVFARLLIRTA